MTRRIRMGAWGVDATAARLADIHGALLCSVTCLGAWIAGVAELQTKIAWADHLYDHATLADLVGRRIEQMTAERPAVPRPANRALLRFLQEMAALITPAEQTSALYHVLLPAVLDSCREHLERTNPVADEPTVRVLYQAAEALESQVIWSSRQRGDEAAVRRMQLYLTEAGGLHGPGAQYDGPAEFRPPLAEMPARDSRFAQLEPGQRMPEAEPLQTPAGRVHLLHNALINLKIPAMEVCGRMIAEFPGAPWALKLDLAAQIWDEARHAQMCADRLVELGGSIGQFPYHHKVWARAMAGATLAERLVSTQTPLDRDALAQAGDLQTSQIMDYMLADEAIHVRTGHKWVDRLGAGKGRG